MGGLKDRSQLAALYHVVDADNVELARVLIEYGADMACQLDSNSLKTTPLAMAVHRRHAGIVRLFIDMGATRDEEMHGNIAQVAIWAAELDAIRALLSTGPKNSATRKPHYVTENLPYAIEVGNKHVIKLLELGADISISGALEKAMQYDHGMEVVGALYNHNPEARFDFQRGFFFLFKAARNNNAKDVRFWVENNFPVGIELDNKNGKAALHIAVANGAVELLAVLPEANSTPEFVNARYQHRMALFTAVKCAKEKWSDRTFQMVKLLVEHGAGNHMGIYDNYGDPRSSEDRNTHSGPAAHLGFDEMRL